MVNVESVRCAWHEKPSFYIDRPNGHKSYTFLHFYKSVDILIGGKIITTSPHACIFYDISTPQYFLSKTELVHDWIHMSGDLSAKLSEAKLDFDTIYYPVGSQFITVITEEIETEYFAERDFKNVLLNIKTDELIIKLARACSGNNYIGVDTGTEESIKQLRSNVFMSLGHKWTVSEMAQKVGLSQSRFYAVYRSIFSNSPTDDLIKARIDSAKNALLFSNRTISQIAEELGYNNITHFMRQFKSITGISPAKFRNCGEMSLE